MAMKLIRGPQQLHFVSIHFAQLYLEFTKNSLERRKSDESQVVLQHLDGRVRNWCEQQKHGFVTPVSFS